MRIGVGLPNTVPGASGKLLVEWAQHAEDLGFSSLMTIGRLVFPTHDELIALEHFKAMAALIPGGSAVIIHNASHFAPWQAPEEFNAIVVKFLHP